VTIAIVDTGVAPLPAFAGRVVPGVDLVGGTTGDPNGHGTALAAVAAGRGGMCASCVVMPVVAVGASGEGSSAVAAAGVRWAAARGARVILFAATTDADAPELDAAIADATAGGATVVLAAGNGSSSDPRVHGYPAATSPEAVTVGALAGTALAPWSNHGGWVDIATSGRRQTLGANGSRLSVEGTSVAAAYVAGVVGTMLVENPALTPAAVQRILLAAGRPVGGLDVRSGRVLDVGAALRAAAAA
jgi:subtilisin family serine protease